MLLLEKHCFFIVSLPHPRKKYKNPSPLALAFIPQDAADRVTSQSVSPP